MYSILLIAIGAVVVLLPFYFDRLHARRYARIIKELKNGIK